MIYSRKNVWELGGDWADPILWYARGVAAMKAKALADHTSWRFYGAIHGIDPALWTQFGYLSKSDKMPSSADQKKFWKQCQHGSWYFLPWHRGYLLAFEANVRAAVTKLGGPKDWALPYWNYFKSNENKLPPAFASPDWPDGKGNNPLFVTQRYGPNNDGNVYVDVSQVNLDALSDPDFTGVASGGSPGFGGVDTGFSHGGSVHGGVETQPHDWVHGLVGGGDPKDPNNIPGLMSDPDTAALDPIFWLHHANIDRLWEAWRKTPPTDVDPTQKQWLKGPGSIGERLFVMPMPDGTAWTYTPAEMSDQSKLNYQYDDLTPAVATPKARVGGAAVATGKNVELVGASGGAVKVSGGEEIRIAVQLDNAVRQKVAKSLGVPAAGASAAPDRVFLNLENVRGLNDAAAFRVYINLPEGSKPADHPELLAGSVALFGVRTASQTDAEHAGKGLTFVLEITKIVDALHLKNALDVNSLDVRIVPIKPIPEGAQISIGRISVYRQGN